MTLRFGTDGVRGVANTELTPAFALGLGRAAAQVLGGPRLLVGTDTRASADLLVSAFTAGVLSEGVDVEQLGVLPTPGVAHLCQVHDAPGAVVSASHNPFADNGIKLFARGGRKLPDDVEARVEAALGALGTPRRTGGDIGRLTSAGGDEAAYVDHLVAALEGRTLDGLRIVLDCANGAASPLAGRVFRAAGAAVHVIGDAPDGTNINAGCGATHPDAVAAAVVAHGAHLGLAFDGDADRLIAVDAKGRVVDGDHVIAVCALDLRRRNALRDGTVVVTVMTNLGFHHAMAANDVRVVETAVGDRYVLEALDAGRYSLGGEQSGHVIFRDLATTGDGMLTGLLLADVVARSGRSLADLAGVMTRLPQVLVNVRLAERHPGLLDELAPHVAQAQAGLGERGRVLVRPSGTEPLVRVMVEAPTDAEARQVADDLAAVVTRAGT
jgi:phosphoglucosamine mutase